MNTELKARIEKAIDKTIINSEEDELWDGWIQPDMAKQMANAAEQVFDSSMAGQQYAAEQNE